jgi:hypothetical protein
MKIPHAFAALLALGMFTAGALAAENELLEKPDEVCMICDSKTRLHKACKWLEVGFDFRYRVYHENNRRLDKTNPAHERAWQRFRPRIWARIKPMENVEINTRFIWEARYWHKPGTMASQFTHDEALFDVLNIKVKKVGGLPLTITAGRQNIRLGDGWLIADGTPRDGSRTTFFDAIRATLVAKEIDTTADVIYIRNHANSAWLHRLIDDKQRDLSEQDESGLIVYLSNKSIKDTTLDGYFIYKHDERVMAAGNNSDLYTFGGRAETMLCPRVQARGELAFQWGRKNDQQVSKVAFNGRIKYLFKDPHANSVHFDYEYRGGDKHNDGAFDILWGRHAQWSPLYNDSVSTLEEPIDYSPNYHRVGVGWRGKPIKKTQLGADYNILFSDRNPNSGTANFSDSGGLRGQLARAFIKYKVNEHVSTRLLGEVFFPGNYYSDRRNDIATFAQFQLVFSW